MKTEDLSLYTGNLVYRGIDFSFAFDGNELRLIPPDDKKLSIHRDWTMTEMAPGVYIPSDPTPIEEEYIIGACNEMGSKIIFFPDKGNYLSYYHFSIYVPLNSYMLCKYDRNLFNRITFYGPELNHIHPVKTGVSLHFDDDKYTNGTDALSNIRYSLPDTTRGVRRCRIAKPQFQFRVSGPVVHEADHGCGGVPAEKMITSYILRIVEFVFPTDSTVRGCVNPVN